MSEKTTQVPAGSLLKADEQRPFEVVRNGGVVYLKSN